MRERACRIVAVGPVLLVRIVERDYGGGAWRLVEEYDVSGEIANLVRASEPVGAFPQMLPDAPAEPAPVHAVRNGNDQ